MKNEDEVAAINQKVADRRAFLKSAGFTGLGLASAGLLAGKMGALDRTPVGKALGLTAADVHAAEMPDLDYAILNFALNLEYLEAEFYTVVTTGKRIADFGIATSGVGKEGPTTGGAQVNFNFSGQPFSGRMLQTIAEEITNDEQIHVKDLRGALGSMAIAKPAINLNALGIGYANFMQFLILARAFEDTGVSAYGGAIPLITSHFYAGNAARILATEALHTGNIRLLVAQAGITVPRLDNLDVLPPPQGKYFSVDGTTAITGVRTTSQVLSIVYANSKTGTNKGGFFPAGVNGIINTV